MVYALSLFAERGSGFRKYRKGKLIIIHWNRTGQGRVRKLACVVGNTINRSSPSWITANNVILFLAWVALLSSGTLADLQLPHLTGNH